MTGSTTTTTTRYVSSSSSFLASRWLTVVGCLEKETVPEINRLTSTSTSTSSSYRARDTAILPFEDFKWN
ncbi:hypothetical protein Q3G72_018061 [Acer saccharum]|nr:hypothetical protein Q3G72_018061 [Acer saccharum]